MDLTFALVTDVHFGPEARFEGKLRKLSAHAPRLLAEVVETLEREVRPAIVFDLGDAIEDESAEIDRARYAEFLSVFARLSCETHHVAGNHDLARLGEAELLRAWGEPGPLRRSFERSGVRFVLLPTYETKDVDVRVRADDLEWLAAELAAATTPVIVLMHHTASDQDLAQNRWFHAAPHLARVVERKRLRRIVAESGKVVAVFNGHLHWNHFDLCDGVPYVTLQSLVENLDDDAPGRPAAAYAVVRVTDTRVSIDVRGAERVRYQIERR